MLIDLVHRLRAAFRKRAVDHELEEELQFHLEQEVQKRIACGRTRAQATREARLALGGLEQVKEECRDARGISLLETTLQDLRYAFRGMRHSPVFALTAIVTLGLGTAAVSTVFTLANTLFFRQLPVAQPDRLVVVQPTRRHGRVPGWAGYSDYAHFRDHTKTLEGLAAAYSTAPFFVSVGARSQEINGAVVSANYFPLLGIKPAFGRFFTQQEDSVPNRDHVAVISFDFWRDWLASSPAALGTTVKINGTVFAVIGIAPQSFLGINVHPDQIYIPTMMAAAGYHWCPNPLGASCHVFDMIGRLREGYTVAQARAEMATLLPAAWAKAQEEDNSGVTAFPLRGVVDPDATRSSEFRFVRLLSCVAGVLLLVCCVNLAHVLIARNSARVREFSIRASLGAGRSRLIQQLISESIALALCGGILGTLLSLALTGALTAIFYSVDGEGHPLHYNFALEPGIVLVVLAVSVVAGCLLSSIPALQSTRRDTVEGLKRQGPGAIAQSRSGRWLAALQTGIAVALAAVAGLLLSSIHHWMNDANFDSSHVALMRLRPRLVNYPPEKAQVYLKKVIDRLNATPGVESASMGAPGAVLLGGETQVSLPPWPEAQAISAGYIEVVPRYFEVLKTPVLRGREFDPYDSLHSLPVAIVSETLARQFWPDGAAIGSTVVVNKQPRRVVGIVADIPWQSRGEPQQPYVYIPFWQNAEQLDARLCIRVKGDPAAMIPMLVAEANQIDRDVPIAETILLSTQVAGAISPLRITAAFTGYAAALAILLSGLGLYGALAFSVSRRTKEIGVRVAMGARTTEVLASVLRDGMIVVLFGVATGVLLATGGTGAIRHLLYGSSADDFPVYARAALMVASIGLFACWLPARRAARLDPMTALREE